MTKQPNTAVTNNTDALFDLGKILQKPPRTGSRGQKGCFGKNTTHKRLASFNRNLELIRKKREELIEAAYQEQKGLSLKVNTGDITPTPAQ